MNQPNDDDFVQAIIELIRAIQTPERVLALMQDLRYQLGETPTVSAVLAEMRKGGSLFAEFGHLPDALNAKGTMAGGPWTDADIVGEGAMVMGNATLRAEARLMAEGRVTKPTLPVWFVKMPCGQRAVIILIGLSVLLSTVDLPEDVLDRLAYLIAALTAYVTSTKWITKR
jgi:hypothetical protein